MFYCWKHEAKRISYEVRETAISVDEKPAKKGKRTNQKPYNRFLNK